MKIKLKPTETFEKSIHELILTESNAGFGGFTYLFLSLFKSTSLLILSSFGNSLLIVVIES